MRNGFIVMTGLPVTIGHQYLIDFAYNYINWLDENRGTSAKLNILIQSRSCEPIPGFSRYLALCAHYKNNPDINIWHYTEDCPQNPSEHPEFWRIIKEICQTHGGVRAGDLVFASELYGIELARVLDCKFIPCNVYRDVIDCSGTKIRQDPLANFAQIMPEMRPYFIEPAIIFGAESTGKTTLAKALAKKLHGYYVPEWAREYLEVSGSEITDDKMQVITNGQFAMEETVRYMSDRPFVIQDTDLLTTLGYYMIFDGVSDFDDLLLNSKYDNIILKRHFHKDGVFYIVMNENIPFEPDPLRYGGNQRQGDTAFWIKLLKEFECSYYQVQSTFREDQLQEVEDLLKTRFLQRANLSSFVRT